MPIVLVLLFALTCALLQAHVFFHPPEGWELADPTRLSPTIKMAFIKKADGLCPSLNLAEEEISADLTEYLKIVKSIHERDRTNHWRKLGKIKTLAGEAQLTEIEKPTKWGKVRMLQLILLKEGKAYVITASALKKDFPHYYREFQKTFYSLTQTNDLLDIIADTERREVLQSKKDELLRQWQNSTPQQNRPFEPFCHPIPEPYSLGVCARGWGHGRLSGWQTDSKSSIFLGQGVLQLPLLQAKTSDSPFEQQEFETKYWLPFQQYIIEKFEDMGSFWQVLLLKEMREQLQ